MTFKIDGNFLATSRQQPQSLLLNQPETLPNGTQFLVMAPGVIAFIPEHCGNKSVAYSCGIHGNETAPIEICDDIVQAILTQEIVLAHRLLVIFGNLPAMDTGTRFIEENLNRLFCNEHANPTAQNNEERERAKLLEQCVSQFFDMGPAQNSRHHYDLHTAIRASKNDKFAVYPFLHGKKHSKEQLAFMYACGVNTILLSQSPTTTFSYYSSVTHNAHAFTVELGKVKAFGENDMSQFADAKMALIALVTQQDYAPSVNLNNVLLYTVNQVINKHKDDFSLHFEDDTPNFYDFEKGALLASETGASYTAQQNGEAIVFPNADVAIGQRALLTVVPTELDI